VLVPKISSKNQITIPVDVLRASGLAAGDDVFIRSDGEGAIVVEARGSRVRRHAGIFSGLYEEGYLDRLRDEWDR
jgi:bifunctional DNA-binding transcriptional regulator/antitoxin component of YhaV-PrlF toxin-antitoxin module